MIPSGASEFVGSSGNAKCHKPRVQETPRFHEAGFLFYAMKFPSDV
jgi:hypothetical protein